MFNFLTFFVPKAEAHVRYIAGDAEVERLAGEDWTYLLSPLLSGSYVMMILATAVIVLGVFFYFVKSHKMEGYFGSIRRRAESYLELLPWLARLPLGIALLGFGTSGVLMTPVLTASGLLSTLQTLAGFLLLTGFLLPVAAFLTLILFLVALTQDVYLIGSLDILALTLTLFIIDARRPGVDHLIGLPDISFNRLKKYVPTILRVSFGAGLAYLAVYEKLLNPRLSEYVVQVTNLTDVIPVSDAMWVFAAGAIELAIGLLLIAGVYTRLVTVITFLVLSLSFFYFKEDVTAHITLFGTLAILFVTGAGPLSFDSWLRNRKSLLN